MEQLLRVWPNGMIMNRFRIISVLGRGGMSTVYLAEDMRLQGTLRALKAAPPLPDGSGRYSSEAYFLMKLSHPQLPLIVDYMPPEKDGVELLVMEYIDGRNLKEIMQGGRVDFPLASVLQIGLQLCEALAYLHAQSPPIIHRDLKPSNVMLDKVGSVKLIDFGISRQYKQGQQQDTIKLGTVGFAAPEQAGSGQSDERSDVYGLGALLYYLISGGTVARPVTNDAPAMEWRLADAGSSASLLKEAIRTMLQQHPQHRYQSIQAARQALLAAAEQESSGYAGKLPFMELAPMKLQVSKPIIGVVSLYPGAGATFTAMLLAKLMARRGAAITALEYQQAGAQWQRMLPAELRLNSYEVMPSNGQYTLFRSKSEGIDWLALNEKDEHAEQSDTDERLLHTLLRKLPGQYVIADLSSGWSKPEAKTLLHECSVIVVVADPHAAKWELAQISRLMEAEQVIRPEGGRLLWVGNKDTSFHGRSEWLQLFPQRPAMLIPFIPYIDMMDMLWSGIHPIDHRRYYSKLRKCAESLTGMLLQACSKQAISNDIRQRES